MSWLSAAPILPGSISASLLADGLVSSQIAAIAPGQIGSHVIARRRTGTTALAYGDTLAGSSLGPVGAVVAVSGAFSGTTNVGLTVGTALTGTWKCLGVYTHSATSEAASISGAALFVRIA